MVRVLLGGVGRRGFVPGMARMTMMGVGVVCLWLGLMTVMSMLVMPAVVACMSWPPARATTLAGSSAMPHFGQRPGSSLTTSGCIGQA